MTYIFEEIVGLSRLIHEPARLAIMTALSVCESADFLYLQRLTGLSKGNLSGHISKLEEAGLLSVKKEFIGKNPNTHVSISDLGHSAIEQHWQKLAELRHTTKTWRPIE
ncbi:ArsR family transcriptional regulator [Ktedonosporobacter rubrisoli]|uniref:ArsR family transcriptional regulator n=1 Tax=Ktedonosporobacter rubrisoli TaxID=2509675 RepID=A0A4P6JRJ2_KTERU|nr:transcriptional regulator [Ktedonosporobacter rubrisoli]QBD77436.1 ArsR family transcriptional regulator [Ktedonosporobacter rubrisoli]